MREAAVVHLEELLPQVPSLSWAGASSRPRYFQLRGIGELEQYQGAPNPSVGFLVDEIDFSGIGMIASTFDVEQVEVLRGPQGTRYGANALGGLIKVKTRDPRAGRGNSAPSSRWAAMASGRPAQSRAAVSTRARTCVRLPGAPCCNARSETASATTGSSAATTPTAGTRRRRVSSSDSPPRAPGRRTSRCCMPISTTATTRSRSTTASTRCRTGPDATRNAPTAHPSTSTSTLRGGRQWRSITAFAESDIVASFDGDWGNDRDWGDAGPYDFFSDTRRLRRTASEDLRLSGESARGHAWITGVWLQRLEEDNHVADDGRYLADAFVRQLDSRYRATSAALYGQADFVVAPATTVTAGLRGEQRDARYDDSDGTAFDPRERLWGGELSVLRRVGERRSVWATLARGYRAGGFNIGTSVPRGPPAVHGGIPVVRRGGLEAAKARQATVASTSTSTTCAVSTRRSRPRCSSTRKTR